LYEPEAPEHEAGHTKLSLQVGRDRDVQVHDSDLDAPLREDPDFKSAGNHFSLSSYLATGMEAKVSP
jgi:hypothetical protein